MTLRHSNVTSANQVVHLPIMSLSCIFAWPASILSASGASWSEMFIQGKSMANVNIHYCIRTFLILLQVWCFRECEPIKRRQRTGNEIQCRFRVIAMRICFTLWTFRSQNESCQSNESKAFKDSQTDSKSTQSSQDNKRKQANWNEKEACKETKGSSWKEKGEESNT